MNHACVGRLAHDWLEYSNTYRPLRVRCRPKRRVGPLFKWRVYTVENE